MKMKFLAFVAVAAMISSCSTDKKDNAATATEDVAATETVVDVNGKWVMESIVVNDTLTVLPGQIESEETQSITFDTDGHFYATTNCNGVQGSYTISGDSITFGNTLSTRMACPDMSVEDALGQVLPQIVTVNVLNDSTIVLTSTEATPSITLKR